VQWARDGVKVRGAEKLATALRDGREDVELFRILAKLVDTVEVGSVDSWKWTGPQPKFATLTNEWGVAKLGERAETLRRLK
jgi:hypothetical protein